MSFSVDGKTAIVTGAANGIGLAIARHLAQAGANVMHDDMDEAGLAKEFGGDGDDTAQPYFAGDLRERLTLANLLSATLDAFDRVDILVNASRQVLPSDFLDVEDKSVETALEQNVLTSLRLSQLVANRMIKQSEGQVEGQAGAIRSPARGEGLVEGDFHRGGDAARPRTRHPPARTSARATRHLPARTSAHFTFLLPSSRRHPGLVAAHAPPQRQRGRVRRRHRAGDARHAAAVQDPLPRAGLRKAARPLLRRRRLGLRLQRPAQGDRPVS